MKKIIKAVLVSASVLCFAGCASNPVTDVINTFIANLGSKAVSETVGSGEPEYVQIQGIETLIDNMEGSSKWDVTTKSKSAATGCKFDSSWDYDTKNSIRVLFEESTDYAAAVYVSEDPAIKDWSKFHTASIWCNNLNAKNMEVALAFTTGKDYTYQVTDKVIFKPGANQGAFSLKNIKGLEKVKAIYILVYVDGDKTAHKGKANFDYLCAYEGK